jgi:general secretion pathway protein A
MTPAHREALAGLSYAVIMKKGFVVLVGEAGTGKTTVLRKLAEMMPESDAQVRMVVNPTLTAREFLELLLHNFGIRDLPDSKTQRLILIEEVLLKTNNAGKTTVLLIDEAHKLSFEVLEEIRLLLNFETRDKKLVQIVLAGQPELNEVLNRPELWQLKQRVAIRLQIGPLAGEQIEEYLRHRWTRTGGGRTLPFTGEAISLIALWSRGIPRLINSICDNALLLAFGTESQIITGDQILEVVRDLDLQPLPAQSRCSSGIAAPLAGEAGLKPHGNGQTEAIEIRDRKAATEIGLLPVATSACIASGSNDRVEGAPGERVRLDTLDRYITEHNKTFFLRRWTAKLRA